MRLLRYGPPGAEAPGLMHDDGTIRDLSGVTADFAGEAVSLAALDRLRELDPDRLPPVEEAVRIGPCLASVPNFHAIGINYARHAEEAGIPVPEEPILFSKATTCLAGPEDPIPQPPGSTRLDYEVELGVVIGARCERVTEAQALAHVAGYCVVNDVSERSWQFERSGQWIKGKSAPGFGPVGPWLVTADAVPDPQALGLRLSVNGETRQSSSTADMIFGVARIVSHLSQLMALVPGDLIATGTPEGVAMGMKPQRWLAPGDRLSLGIDGLGEQRTPVVAG